MGKLSGTRRDVLRQGAAAIGAATIASSAGCMGILGGGGDYTKWMPEPGTIRDEDHYSISAFDLKSLAEHEDEFDGWNFDSVEEQWEPADVDWEDVGLYLRFNGVTVAEVDLEQEEVVEAYEDEDYDEEDEHEGYKLMLGPQERMMAAVGSDALVLTGSGYGSVEDPQDAVEAIIDAKNGDEDRYADESDAFGELSGKLGGGDIVRGSTQEPTEEDDPERGRFENQVAQGQQISVNGEESDGKWVLVFEDEDDVDTGDVEDWVEESQDSDGQFDDWDDVEVNGNGRSVIVKATADTDDL